MKKHLFTVPLGEQGLRTYKVRLFLVFITGLFFSSHASAALLDSAFSQNNQEAIIYVAPGTKIIGASDFSNARIIEIPKVASVSAKSDNKVSSVPVSKQLTAKHDEIEQKSKIVQAKISKAVKTFYNSSPKSEWFSLSNSIFNSAAVSTNSASSKFSPIAVLTKINLEILMLFTSDQNFHFSLSFLQLCKFRSSSLRAPPQFIL